MTIFAFSLSDTFDTIGTFIGTGRKTGIFSDEDQQALEKGKGFRSKMDKALFADSTATSIGAILGTSNTTTYGERGWHRRRRKNRFDQCCDRCFVHPQCVLLPVPQRDSQRGDCSGSNCCWYHDAQFLQGG